MMKRQFFTLIALSFFLLPRQGSSYGPAVVNTTTKTIVKWAMPMTYHRETVLTVNGKNVEPFLTNSVASWAGATGSGVVMNPESLKDSAGATTQDVTGSNVCSFLFDASICPAGPATDGQNPIVFDADGSIVEKFFGASNRYSTLGFAGIVRFSTTTNTVSKGEGVFNAACLEGAKDAACPASTTITSDDLEAIITHEMGHLLGCNHSQVNLTEATDGDASNNSLITTMYPFFIFGTGLYIKTLERDDEICVASLYPSSNFASTTCRIEGTVFDQDNQKMQCANLIARNVKPEKSKTDAISYVSGQLSAGGSSDGDFVIQGLTAGETYSLEAEPINTKIIGSSGIKPCDGAPSSYPSGQTFPPTFTHYNHPTNITCAKGGDATTGVNVTLAGVNANPGGTTVTTTTTDTDSGSGGCSLIP